MFLAISQCAIELPSCDLHFMNVLSYIAWPYRFAKETPTWADTVDQSPRTFTLPQPSWAANKTRESGPPEKCSNTPWSSFKAALLHWKERTQWMWEVSRGTQRWDLSSRPQRGGQNSENKHSRVNLRSRDNKHVWLYCAGIIMSYFGCFLVLVHGRLVLLPVCLTL